MDGSHKLKTFDDDLKEIKRKLEERERTGTRVHMAEIHGDFIKQCVDQSRVRVQWVKLKKT